MFCVEPITDSISGSITGTAEVKYGSNGSFTANVTSANGLSLTYSWRLGNTNYGSIANSTSRTCRVTPTSNQSTRYTNLYCDIRSVSSGNVIGTSVTKSLALTFKK